MATKVPAAAKNMTPTPKMAPGPKSTNLGGKDAPAGRPMSKIGKKDMPKIGKAC
jgi:hypothetical protein